jgi:hypothetical protein
LTDYRTAWNHPVTGPDAFRWGGLDFNTEETAVDPLLPNCVEPSPVGNERRIPFTPDSGPCTLADRTAAPRLRFFGAEPVRIPRAAEVFGNAGRVS